ncbi:uncharacterized protein XM38_030520 [Halomicronema hongdechloris C2206]|uniref:Uncharacterized protein n=1 Tax=Halomicronema hongdechloris C2206 TaxID=1641165 RepID=A0A1Z3HP79_9CYAN|nr:hypothetical protein [Halomicronema hongdechloris]ASC72098.1 uncharacterized protein XM38_030520 [Halomicronema hongdechloris C2206]
MAGTVEQIRRELDSLTEATAALAEDFQELYKHYLQALGKAARQQLILASYRLCTQAYPDAFLNLSVAQRQKLQVAIRELGDEAQEHLQASLQVWQASPMEWLEQYLTHELSLPEEQSSEPIDESSASESTLPEDTPEETDAEMSLETNTSQSPSTEGPEVSKAAEGPVATPDMIAKAAAAALRQIREGTDESAAARATSPDAKEPLTPARLAKKHLHLEQHIRTVLQGVTKTANFLLKKAGILPDLPEVVLAAAAESTAMDRGPSPPNLLNVLVEMRDRISDDQSEVDLDQDLDQQEEEEAADHEDQDDSRVTHLMAIHLQLSDIEFADPQTSLWRSRLREALAKLKKLGRQYQKKQQEQAIAEAEAAWRAIWYDD